MTDYEQRLARLEQQLNGINNSTEPKTEEEATREFVAKLFNQED